MVDIVDCVGAVLHRLHFLGIDIQRAAAEFAREAARRVALDIAAVKEGDVASFQLRNDIQSQRQKLSDVENRRRRVADRAAADRFIAYADARKVARGTMTHKAA